MHIDINIDGVKTTHLIETLYREGIWDEDFASHMSQHHITGAWMTILIPKTPGFQSVHTLNHIDSLTGFYIGILYAMNRYKWPTQSVSYSRRITADACSHILQEVLE